MKSTYRGSVFFSLLLIPAFASAIFLLPASVQAIPTLQLYIEGSVYDTFTETWVLENGGGPVRVWAIGDVASYGDISDVKLAIAYPDPGDASVVFTITPSTTDLITDDPSTPGSPVLLQTVTDGSTPTLSSGKELPWHGVYGEGIHWQEFDLGDFTLTDSPIGDFIDQFPTEFPSLGQVNVYEIVFSGTDSVHFDLYDSIAAGNRGKKIKSVFDPFSHDAESGGVPVPEPATMLLLGSGLIGLAGFRKRFRKH